MTATIVEDGDAVVFNELVDGNAPIGSIKSLRILTRSSALSRKLVARRFNVSISSVVR